MPKDHAVFFAAAAHSIEKSRGSRRRAEKCVQNGLKNERSTARFSIMRYLIWCVRIVLFLLLLGFTVRNVETVTLRYYFGYEWHAPLVLVILLFFALGVAIGVLSCLGKIFRQRRKIATFRKKYPLTEEEHG